MRRDTWRTVNAVADGARAALAAMGVGFVFAVVSVVLIEGVHLPPVPVLVVGGIVTWSVIVTLSAWLGLRTRRRFR